MFEFFRFRREQRVNPTRPLHACLTLGIVGALVLGSSLALRHAVASRPDQSVAVVTLHSPIAGSVAAEGDLILGWRGARKGAEYVLFLSPGDIEGRSLESLMADPNVIRTETTRTSMPLSQLVRGESGTTSWSWAVAVKDGTGRHVLSAPSAFQSVKTFEASSPNRLLVRETARGVQPALPAASGTIELSSGFRFDPLGDGPPATPALLAAPLIHAGETGSYLVQMTEAIEAADREALIASGATLVTYLPSLTYLVRMTPEAEKTVASLPSVRWVGVYQPAYKFGPELTSKAGTGPLPMTVLLFPDADLGLAHSALRTMGGDILEATDSGRNKLLRVRLDPARAAELARRNDVAWIEPYIEPHTNNALAQWVVQTNTSNSRRVWDMGLRGENQVVHTSDSGIRTSHFAFRDTAVPITDFGDYPTHRKVIAYKLGALNSGILFGDALGASYHGTHTAGTIIGDDSPFAANTNDGMALKAKIWFSDVGASTNSIVAPGDLNLLFQPPYDGNAGGAARVSSNSWGGDAAGRYTVHSMTADQFMWDHKDFLVNFSNGNAGPQPATVGSPATMKSGVSSGASQNGLDSGTYAFFSSQGPAADGRIKPTIMSPGDGQVPILGLISANGAGDTGYKGLSGTSMSCPTVTGAILLMRQYLMEGWYPTGVPTPGNAFTPSGAVLKAMAISSTDNDMNGQPIPNNIVGWGRIKLDNILYFPGDAARTALVDETGGLLTGEFLEYDIEVTSSTVPLKITLCWYDKEGSPAAVRQLVNDLDLTVTDPGNVSYRGNFLQNGESLPGGLRDTLNVEEGVRRTTPLTGIWTVRVSGANVPFGAQPFALAISGSLGGNAGVVQLDRMRYGAGDQIEIRVEDLNAVPPVSVEVTSDTESAGEMLTLSGANGVFTGTMATTADLSASDGLISLAHGDQITVTYQDLSPAQSTVVTAMADFTGPLITNVGGTSSDVSRTITWTTDVPSSSRIYYGSTPALGQSSVLDPDLVTAHAVTISGLAAETTYWFDIESTDQVGNSTYDDAGTNHYQFSTTRTGDILLIIGDSTFLLEERYLSGFKNYGWESTLWKTEADNPPLGHRTMGLRSKSAVLYQAGYEQYPALSDAARDSLALYLDGGGRFSISTHDLAWSFATASSGFSTPGRIAWMQNYLHINFVEDPATWSLNLGVTGDPISGAYAAGIGYTPQRAGGAGDEITVNAGTGTGSVIWSDTDATVGNIALRWQNNAPNGNPANAVWGGTPSRVVTNCYEWAQIDQASVREDILDKTLIWLLGHDHPDAVLAAPNGGEIVTGNNVNISWTATPYGGTAIDSQALYFSPDDGATWTLITALPGASPYNWDVSALPNSPSYRVRVVVEDDAAPALRGRDESDATFTLNRPGGDDRGPAVVAGSIGSDPNPIHNQAPATLTATLSDALFGNADVVGAEWSFGPAPATAGSGQVMSGSFNASTVSVTATIPIGTLDAGEVLIWVRGRDDHGNWGAATARQFHVNGTSTSGVNDLPVAARWSLEQNSPNPFNPVTTIRFSLPVAGEAELSIYTVQGRKVTTLVSGHQPAGPRDVVWDGRSDAGGPVASGIYFYTLVAPDYRSTRKMVLSK